MKTKVDIYTKVTARIIEQLEQGTRPWIRPWSDCRDGRSVLCPLRACGQTYRGINVLLLWDAALEKGYTCNIWMTFKQAETYQAHVRKGEKGTGIVYADRASKLGVDERGEEIEQQYSFLKSYTAFNVEQIAGLPAHFYEPPAPQDEGRSLELIEEAESYIHNTGAVIRHGGDCAFYAPAPDIIQLPKPESFTDVQSYTVTKAHELIHWTGHEKRQAREFGKRFGDQAYAFEELVAELGAAFLCAELGMTPEPREDHAQYLAHWLKILHDDKRAIFTAAGLAQKAMDYLNDLQGKAAETMAA